MKILSLTVENIKRVKAVQITPDGSAVIISGKNAQGKSSTIDAIEMAFGGKDAIPSRPVRDGQTDARIVCETEKYVVTRHWTGADKTYLKVERKPDPGEEGKNITQGSPQDILDNLVGDISFDPLAFATTPSKDQLQMLKKLAKLDFTDLDKEYKAKFDERRDVKRDGENYKAQLENYGEVNTAVPEFNIDEVKDQITQAKGLNALHEENKREIEDRKSRMSTLNVNVQDVKDQIKNLEDRLHGYIEQRNKIDGEITELLGWEGKTVDIAQFDAKIQEWNKYEANAKLIDQKKIVAEKLAETRNKWAGLDARLKAIDEAKNKMVTEANMPINGLTLGDSEILYNGIPFIQLSTSEQIRVSMAIAMALNPKLKVILIKNGSLLDSDAIKELEAIATDKGFQVWVEKVADTPDGNSIFIEDGEIKSN